MYSTDTDGGSDGRSIGAILMALMMVVSMVAIGGIAAQPAAADHSNDFPSDRSELELGEILVDDDFESGEFNESDQVSNTIQGAMEKAESLEGVGNVKIYIRTGDYEENVVVDQQVDLIGQSPVNSLARTPKEDQVTLTAATASEPAMTIQHDSVTVTQMAIRSGGDASTVLVESGPDQTENVKDLVFKNNIVSAGDGQIGFEAEPMNFGNPFNSPVNELRNNEFTTEEGVNALYLAFIGGSAAGTGAEQPGENLDPSETSYLIEGNGFTTEAPGLTDTGPETTDVSLHLEADKADVVGNDFPALGSGGGPGYEVVVAGDGNEFLDNTLDSTDFEDGLELFDGTSDFTASGNLIENAFGAGVWFQSNHANVEISNNDILNNDGDGINAFDVNTLDILNNDVDNNGGDGVFVTNSQNVTIAGNNGVTNNGDNGIYVNGTSQDVTIADNTASNNDINGILASGTANVTVDGNTAEDNGGNGIEMLGTDSGTDVLRNHVGNNGENGVVAAGTVGELSITQNTIESHDEPITPAPAGILIRAVEGASVEDNELLDNTQGIRVDGADTTVGIERNKLDGYETGIVFENYNTSDPSYAIYNALLVEEGAVDIENNVDHRVEVILNYFGTGSSVESTHDIAEYAEFAGSGKEVVYDPFLPDRSPVDDSPSVGVTSSSAIDTTGPSNTQEFAHELTLEGSGNGLGTNAITVAFPADIEGDATEVFDDVPAGTQVMAYDESAGSFVPIASMDQVNGLDAFMITGLEAGQEATVTFEYMGSPTPEEKNLVEGYNFVGAPQKGNVNAMFSATLSSDDSQVIHSFRDAEDQPDFTDSDTAQRNADDLWFTSTEDASGDGNFAVVGSNLGSATDTVSPYTGYWVIIDEDADSDAKIISTYPASGSAETEVVLLRTSQTF